MTINTEQLEQLSIARGMVSKAHEIFVDVAGELTGVDEDAANRVEHVGDISLQFAEEAEALIETYNGEDGS